MKLKERLAFDARKLYIQKYDCIEYEMSFDDGYREGFEKARSLAAKIAYAPGFDGTGDEIDCLGEEEV